MHESGISDAEVRAQAAKIVGSHEFKGSDRLAQFLLYILGETLEGRACDIKEYVIGVTVYRKGNDFDPRIDSTVRVEASRLRRKLASYYAHEGKDDAIVITVPKGAYIPAIELHPPSAEQCSVGEEPSGAPGVVKPARGRQLWWVAIALLALVAITGAVMRWEPLPGHETAFEAIPLTTYPGSEDGPSFSPDATQVAYSGGQHERQDIYVKLVGGGPPLQLTTDPGDHYWPAWSPDGKWLAFNARHQDGRNGVFLMPALGGPERLLATLDSEACECESYVDWSPDGKWLAVSPSAAAFDSSHGIVLISVETGSRRDLVKENPEMARTSFGRFSPEGRRLTFTRQTDQYVAQLCVADLSPDMRVTGKPRPITSSDMPLAYPAWTIDGREIVFMSGQATSSGSIARVRADGVGGVRRISSLGYTSGPIGIARKGGRMAFSRGGIDSDIWQFDTKKVDAPRRWIASTLYDTAGEYSWDGRKIAFSSNRSGSREIWVCDADGSNAMQLTHLGGPMTGTPRWSPDGRQIAFDSRPGGNPDVFVIGAEGSGLRRLTNDPGEDARPAWSPDGKWIYFSSERSGRSEIWRIALAGGAAEQVTRQGGSSAYASRDGEWIYYMRTRLRGPLWRVKPDSSGDSMAVNQEVAWLAFTTMPTGLYFLNLAGGEYRIQRLLPDGKIADVLPLPFAPGLGLSFSPDERRVLVTKPDENGTDLMLVEDFH